MDPILYWNEVALEANRVSFTNGKKEQPGPTLSSRALAIVHLAMMLMQGYEVINSLLLTYLLIFLAYLVRNQIPQPMLR